MTALKRYCELGDAKEVARPLQSKIKRVKSHVVKLFVSVYVV